MGDLISKANLGVNRSQNIPNKNHEIMFIFRESVLLFCSISQAVANDRVKIHAKVFVTQMGDTIDSNMG